MDLRQNSRQTFRYRGTKMRSASMSGQVIVCPQAMAFKHEPKPDGLSGTSVSASENAAGKLGNTRVRYGYAYRP
jgi:hypothetical protein